MLANEPDGARSLLIKPSSIRSSQETQKKLPRYRYADKFVLGCASVPLHCGPRLHHLALHGDARGKRLSSGGFETVPVWSLLEQTQVSAFADLFRTCGFADSSVSTSVSVQTYKQTLY